MSNYWNKYFDETDIKSWDILQFYKDWICTYKQNPEKLTYRMSTDALAKSLRSIVNNSPDTAKVEKAKNLLSDLECGQKRKSGNCIDKLWIKIENKYKERERTNVICSDTGIQLANCNGV
ncbi:hypothetical protein RhiirA4_410313, partial [Rhizophagus irregularis]